VFVTIAAVSSALLLARGGTTPGKILSGLHVVGGDGGPVGTRKAFVREVLGKWVVTLGLPLAAARLYIGQGWVSTVYDLVIATALLALIGIRCAYRGRTWHDRIAGTRIVRGASAPRSARRSLGIVAGAVALAAMIAGGTYVSRGWVPAKFMLYRDPRPIGRYTRFLEQTTDTPVDYIISLFDRADVVILCENFHPEFTQWDFIFDIVRDPRFIERVGRVFTEYGALQDQPTLDRFLMTPGLSPGEVKHQALALVRNNNHWPGWDNTNFFTYLQRLYRLNESIGPGRKVRHFFTDRGPGWDGLTREEYATYSAHRNRDEEMAHTVIEQLTHERSEAVSGPKALVVMNYRHAFAPIRRNGEPMPNTGGYLYEAFPGRTANVLLGPYTIPFLFAPIHGGRWDLAFQAAQYRPVGFDLAGSPFGDDAFDLMPIPPWVKGRYRYRDIFTGMVMVRPLNEMFFEHGIAGYYDSYEAEALRRARLLDDDYGESIREQIAWYEAGMPGRRSPHPTFRFQTTVELLTLGVFALALPWAFIAFLLAGGVRRAGKEPGSVSHSRAVRTSLR
jgi:hypothetical protein